MLFPLYSDKRLSRFPLVTILLIGLNIAVFLLQVTTPGSVKQSVWMFGVIPYEFFHPGTVQIAGRVVPPLTVITGMFTHGGFLHLSFNMLFLWVFGRNVEDDFGKFGFLIFYFGAGIIATLAFVLAFPSTQIPLVGASGAIAGVLGAYFLRFPLTRIYCLFFFILYIKIIRVPAFIVLGLWFLVQFLSCMADMTSAAGAAGEGGIAWLSHIAGFVTGLVWTLLILRKRFHERYRGR